MSPALFLKQALCHGFTGVHGAAHKGSGKEFDGVYVQQHLFIYLFIEAVKKKKLTKS